MKKKILIIIGIIALIAILITAIICVIKYNKNGHICMIEKNKLRQLENSEHSMEIIKDYEIKGAGLESVGFQKVFVNMEDKIAYMVAYNDNIGKVTKFDFLNCHHPNIYEIKLTNEGINKLKEYANLPLEDERRIETNEGLNINVVLGVKYIIKYQGKENTIKAFNGIEEKLDFVKLFDEKTKEY